MTYLAGPVYTHLAISCSTSSRPTSFANLDRIYTAIPPRVLLQLQISDHTATDPAIYTLSDHVPIVFGIAVRAPIPSSARPVPFVAHFRRRRTPRAFRRSPASRAW